MPDLDVTVRILNVDGVTEILDLADAAGYEVTSIAMPDRAFRRTVAVSDDVEGDVEQQAVLDSGRYLVGVMVVGGTHAQVEARRGTLLAAAELRSYLLEVTVEGQTQTWRARRADTVTGTEQHDLIDMKRPMNLSIPVQPRTNEELA